MVLTGGLAESVSENWEMVAVSLLVVAGIIVAAFFVERHFRKKNGAEREMSKIHYMTLIALLSTMAGVLMVFEFPVPFVAPGFYKVDLSEVPIIVGAFVMGPLAGVIMEFIKVMINIFINGTTSAFVGEFANFTIGAAFVVPAAIIYIIKKSRKTAVVGLISGTAVTAVVGFMTNAFILLPFYAAAFGGIDKIIALGNKVNPAIDSVVTFCLIAVVPFNLIKFSLVSIVTFLTYHKLSPVLKLKKH